MFISFLGTPLHQPEEDQLILPNALQQQQAQNQQNSSQVPPLAPMGGLTPTLGLGMGHAMSIQPTKYVTGFAMPISSVTSQTPVSKYSFTRCIQMYKLYPKYKSYLQIHLLKFLWVLIQIEDSLSSSNFSKRLLLLPNVCKQLLLNVLNYNIVHEINVWFQSFPMFLVHFK